MSCDLMTCGLMSCCLTSNILWCNVLWSSVLWSNILWSNLLWSNRDMSYSVGWEVCVLVVIVQTKLTDSKSSHCSQSGPSLWGGHSFHIKYSTICFIISIEIYSKIYQDFIIILMFKNRLKSFNYSSYHAFVSTNIYIF